MDGSGRLKVEEGLSEVRIQVPGELHLVGAIFWGMYALVSLGAASGVVFGPVSFREVGILLGVLGLLFGAAWLVWMALSWLIHRMQTGSRLAGVVVFASVFLSFAPILLLGVGISVGTTAGFAGLTALFYFLFLKALAGPAPAVTLDQATVTVTHRRARTVVPLEAITEVTPARRWRSPAMLGETPVPGLSGMSEAEWGWLSARILESAERRQAALAAEGHDLSQAAVPPRALEALTRR